MSDFENGYLDDDQSSFLPSDEEMLSDGSDSDIDRGDEALELEIDRSSSSEAPHHLSYQDTDPGPLSAPKPFSPTHPPGLKQLQEDGKWTRRSCLNFMSPGSFFCLFFTPTIMSLLCDWTNKNADMKGPERQRLFSSWEPVNPEEMYRFFALLMYMSIVRVPRISMYWWTKSLFHGLWARSFMTRDRFYQIQCFLKCSDPDREVEGDKLKKIRSLVEYIRHKSMKYFQPGEQISIDERMLPKKSRTFRQYIKDKPTKQGMKLWVLADSCTGYTYNFDIYLGKAGSVVSKNGLAYDVVTKLCSPLFNQGYRLFVDDFYSSVHLFNDLRKNSVYACGTINLNRKGIPRGLKDTKHFSKEHRGEMRWVREGNLLFLQWNDNKVVSFISSFHVNKPKQIRYCSRRTKVENQFNKIEVRQPYLVSEYNKYMGGVDKSDQLIGKYKILRRTLKYWKTILYHCIDIAKVNSFILFQEFRKQNSNLSQLERPASFSQLDFTIELLKELGKISESNQVPLYNPVSCKRKSSSSCDVHQYVAVPTNIQRNCKRCWRLEKKERKSRVKCGVCNNHFCFLVDRNCIMSEHSV